MDRLILDTNILMHLVRGDKIAGEVKAYIDRKEDPNLFVSVVSIAEAESLVVQPEICISNSIAASNYFKISLYVAVFDITIAVLCFSLQTA